MTVREVIEHNQSVLAEGGPRITAGFQTYVASRDRPRKKVLVGGLGAAGVGRTWFPEGPAHAQLLGYSGAPEGDSTTKINPEDEVARECEGDRV